MKNLQAATIDGLEARPVDVEATFTKGLPAFGIVGLAGSSIQESKDRVKSALLTNGFSFPPLRITVNLSPSDINKSGSHFDLAIALAIALQDEEASTDGIYVFGELGLDGKVKDARSIFPILLSLKNRGMVDRAIVPKESLEALSLIPGILFSGVDSLSEAIALCKGESEGVKVESAPIEGEPLIVGEESFWFARDYPEDFGEVKGQEAAKRAALVAAAGMHNILMEGSPGCGKSMIAKRVRHILPPMSLEEILHLNQYALLGDEEASFRPVRPFRSPHHSASKPSIFGGGTANARIGEVALANGGVLFFDEFPHFSKTVLEALREPLQDHKVLISRVNSKVEYRTSFLFAAAQNPCPCGNLLSTVHPCRCNDLEIKRYKQRLSDPLLDRIEIFVTMQESETDAKSSVDSASMHKRVVAAFIKQKERGQKRLNGKLDEKDIEKYCILEPQAQEVLQRAVQSFGLSHRGVGNAKKVARTIADLDASEIIAKSHILEALSLRRRA